MKRISLIWAIYLLTACAATPESELDLAGAALWLAAEEYPDLDPQVYLGRLESLAERVRSAWGRRRGVVAARSSGAPARPLLQKLL